MAAALDDFKALSGDRPAAISYQRSIEPKFKQCSNDLKTLVDQCTTKYTGNPTLH